MPKDLINGGLPSAQRQTLRVVVVNERTSAPVDFETAMVILGESQQS